MASNDSVLPLMRRTVITVQVITAAGGTQVVQTYRFARSHLEELARHRDLPANATPTARLAFLRQAWLVIDAAVASLGEIRFDSHSMRQTSLTQ
jgi:hypothetical protein